MKYGFLLTFSIFTLISNLSLAGQPKDEDELLFLPKGTKLIVEKDLLFPSGVKRIFFQKGLATIEAETIDGNARYCFMLLKMPSSKDRVLEKEMVVVTNGTYRASTSMVELEVNQPSGIFDVGCANSPREIDRKPTIGQFKKELDGIFEVVMPGPDPIH